MDLSIIVVSLENCKQHIDCINSYDNYGISYEIIVCSDKTEKNLLNTKYIEDPHTSVKAFNKSYQNSIGDYIFTFPGGAIPQPNMFKMIDHMETLEYKICSFGDDDGLVYYIDGWASELYNLTYSPSIIRFPTFHRNFINNYLDGVIFNESFTHHYVDHWLAAFCSKKLNKHIQENTNLRITTIPHSSIKTYDYSDKIVFTELLKRSDSYNFKL